MTFIRMWNGKDENPLDNTRREWEVRKYISFSIKGSRIMG